MAGTTGIICATSDGEPIYRKTFYSEDENVADKLIPHGNGAAIREANGTSAKIMAEVNATKQVDLEDSIAEVENSNTINSIDDLEVVQENTVIETDSANEVEVADDEGVESFEL